jgi:rhamnosyltransferase
MRSAFGSHSGEGLRFIRSEMNYLARHAFLQIPRALCQTAAKLIGYRLGRLERWLPNGLKRKISMAPRFWR